MSGPKTSQYELAEINRRRQEEAMRRRQAEIAERQRLERERREAKERKRREKIEEKERQRQARINADIRKEEAGIKADSAAFDSMFVKIREITEQAQRKMQEKPAETSYKMPEIKADRNDTLKFENPTQVLDFDTVFEQVKKQMPIPEDCEAEIGDIVKELIQEPIELHSLLDTYVPVKKEEASLELRQFEELLFKMEEEYKDIVRDRAFFKQEREEIIRFEEVCKRMQEYRSYSILNDVYYNDFQKLKKARKKWHSDYEKWKQPFEEIYIRYRSICEMLEIIPEHYALNVKTVKMDIEILQKECERLEKEYLQKQESLEITRVFNEVMEEMGYKVLGTKNVSKKSGGQIKNTVFTYGEGSAIHVMDNGEKITMEVVGIEDEYRELDSNEKEYLKEEQEYFCDSFHEIEEELAKRGVVLKNRIKMLRPSVEYASVMDMKGYEITEQKVQTKKLSKVDKKAKRKKADKKYMKQ